jgi:hypothetical protein
MTVAGLDGQIEIVTLTIACDGRMRNRAKTRDYEDPRQKKSADRRDLVIGRRGTRPGAPVTKAD